MNPTQSPLPIDSILPGLRQALRQQVSAVLVATPGAGKTTRVPLALLNEPWLQGRKIVMLEPRRLAARLAAERLALSLAQKVGEVVGYRVRMDSRVSSATRIEVVTEGIFTRRLQDDAALDGVGLVIFDEFHERSLDADLGLALALDARQALRPDLRVLVMSATINAAGIAGLLGDAPILESNHRPHPVATRYVPRDPATRLEEAVATAVLKAVRDEDGSVLAFLPGEREIRRVADALTERLPSADIDVAPLFGALSWADQQRAVAPAPPGRRKVVLATTIAETSLTIEGVSVVVDCGLKRSPRFDPRRGMSELTTVRVSRASAEQRRGRAGRLGPGVCYRLWAEAEDRALAAFDPPEIEHADLAPLALDLAAWGVARPDSLSWMTPPPVAAFAQARDLLQGLGALDRELRITDEGKAMARLPLHPRLAHLVRAGVSAGVGALACDLAALLSERDFLGRGDIDLRSRLSAFRSQAPQRLRDAARQIRELVGITRGVTSSDKAAADEVGLLVAAAYPDRIAQNRGQIGKFRLSGGGSAVVDTQDSLARSEFLAVADLDGAASDAKVFLAAPVDRVGLERHFAASIVSADDVAWDVRTEAVISRRARRLGALILDEQPLDKPEPELLVSAVCDGIRRLGIDVLPWSGALTTTRERVAFVRKLESEGSWPDLGDRALTENLEQWLGPFLTGITRRSHFARIDLRAAIEALLPWPLTNRLEQLAPSRLTVPSGSSIAIDYAGSGGPALSVKLQEVFGLTATPTVAGGRVPVTLHLLSPAQRPIAVTADLASFWRNAYPAVRSEMRGRYPRHTWPEDPLSAVPTRRTIKPRS
ncbi:MAG: ATP-dependent helicase HrpB [Alphaproteobacteria bacterium]|nr:ATP-dependent helicase HrpB [Alphaproteobacteria bacterium]